MGRKCKVTYIKHSGVLVETESRYLLFDYWEGEIPRLDSGKALYVFASHAHHDHFTKDIFKLENTCVNVSYILSSDIRDASNAWKSAENVIFIGDNEERQYEDMNIRTLWSTDEGVAFLVKTDGLTIYHAGDLHWWYWPADPVDDNEGRRRREYHGEIARLEGEKIDIAFVVLDPRLAHTGGYGMDSFLSMIGSRYVFPIHFWENYRYVQEYKDKNEKKYPTCCIKGIEHQGQVFELEL